MRFEEALKLLGQSTPQIMKRKLWSESSPYKYLWVTGIGTVVASVGNGNSCPPLMQQADYLATDWDVTPNP